MYIDTHTHLNLGAFEDDWLEVVKKAKKDGVKKMIVIGTDLESSKKAVKMAEEVEGLYAVVGFHPHHCKDLIRFKRQDLRIKNIANGLKKLARSEKVVGIGECGLDYHVYQKTKYKNKKMTPRLKNLQKQVFGKQIQLAKELNLPMVVHNREAQKDILDVMDHFCRIDGKYLKGVFHCISGSVSYLTSLLKKGFFVGVDGNVTYSEEVKRLVKEVPIEKLLIETDSPYLLPEPLRSLNKKVPNHLSLKLQTAGGSEPCLRNTPVNVKIVAEFVAKLKNVSLDNIRASSTKNAEALFNI